MLSDILHYKCPWCFEPILVYRNELNCRIFRHAVFKKDGQQLNPHASKEECDNVVEQGLVWGCGKPFKIIDDSTIEKCDYI